MSTQEIENTIAAQRAELARTLDQIEDKLNVPKQVGLLGERAKASYEKHPLPWIAGAAAVAVGVVGLVAWALMSDD